MASLRYLYLQQSQTQQDEEEEEKEVAGVLTSLALVYKKTLLVGKSDLGREAIEAILAELGCIYRDSRAWEDPDLSQAVFDGFFAAAETCGRVWPVSDSLRVALDFLLETALAGWSTSSSAEPPAASCREEKSHLFLFMHRGLLLCPEVILSLNGITNLISLAVESLSILWQGILIAPELGRSSCLFMSRLPSSFLTPHATPCLEAVLRSIVSSSSREQLPGYADLFLNLINSNPQAAISTIEPVLEELIRSGGLGSVVERDARSLFVQLVARLRSVPRRFKLMVVDFGQVCRGLQPSQVLLDYTVQ
eukprot:TRINITY_DN17850_c0_g1_i1.p1 TRINITY_DN17850_c0_g1~~TRINITY_DN17850_c0_g1_i1.p1  ORF type:complete len:307 (+),score=67.14 TRINITY_DN17850_c0_g1_i1:765-1685(+)